MQNIIRSLPCGQEVKGLIDGFNAKPLKGRVLAREIAQVLPEPPEAHDGSMLQNL